MDRREKASFINKSEYYLAKHTHIYDLISPKKMLQAKRKRESSKSFIAVNKKTKKRVKKWQGKWLMFFGTYRIFPKKCVCKTTKL